MAPKGFCFWCMNISKVYDYETEVTTNQSERFNTLIKALQGWKEIPLDAIIQSMNMLQTYFLNEINMGQSRSWQLHSEVMLLELSHSSSTVETNEF